MDRKPEWPRDFRPVLEALAAVRRLAAETHDPSLEGAECYCVWGDGAVTRRARGPGGYSSEPVLRPALAGSYGPFPVGGAGAYVCVPTAGAAEALRAAMGARAPAFAEGAETLGALIAAAHDPRLPAVEGDHAYRIWQDGEITSQKGGSLLGRRTVHTISPPLAGVRRPMPAGDPDADSYAWVTHSDALQIRAAMAAVLGAPDPCRSAEELARAAELAAPEALVGWIAERGAATLRDAREASGPPG